MTERISKNLLKGKPFTIESFNKALVDGGHSAYSPRFMNIKPVSVFASNQYFRIVRLIQNEALFETNTIHEHIFESQKDLTDFFAKNPDMLEGIDKDRRFKVYSEHVNSMSGQRLLALVGYESLILMLKGRRIYV